MDFKTVENYIKKQGFDFIKNKDFDKNCLNKEESKNPEAPLAFEIDFNNNGKNEWVVYIRKTTEGKD